MQLGRQIINHSDYAAEEAEGSEEMQVERDVMAVVLAGGRRLRLGPQVRKMQRRVFVWSTYQKQTESEKQGKERCPLVLRFLTHKWAAATPAGREDSGRGSGDDGEKWAETGDVRGPQLQAPDQAGGRSQGRGETPCRVIS